MKGRTVVTLIGGGDPSLTQVLADQGQVVQFDRSPPITMDGLIEAVSYDMNRTKRDSLVIRDIRSLRRVHGFEWVRTDVNRRDASRRATRVRRDYGALLPQVFP